MVEKNTAPRIAVIAALEPEIEILRNRLENPNPVRIVNTEFVTGWLSGKPVVVFYSGVSMVNAAMTTQLALDHFAISTIVVSGVAGGADPELSIGDITVPVRWGQYMEMAFARETGNGFELPPFFSSDFPSFGMMHTLNINVSDEFAGHEKGRFWFPADAELLAAARAAAEKVTLSDTTTDDGSLARQPKVYVGGGGVSGTAFVDNAEFRKWACDTFEARVLDMETAAIAHVAEVNKVPFLAFRALSDLAGGEEGANQFDKFLELAGENLANLVEAFLQEID